MRRSRFQNSVASAFGDMQLAYGAHCLEREPLIPTLTCCFLNGQGYPKTCVTSRIMTAGSPPTVELEKILVVDDEEAIREVVSTMLQAKGYDCTAVNNGRAAQEHVKRMTPDLVLSDMIMPEMDGIKLLD